MNKPNLKNSCLKLFIKVDYGSSFIKSWLLAVYHCLLELLPLSVWLLKLALMFWFYQLFSGHSCLLHHQPPFIEKIIETPTKPLLLLMLLSWILLNNLATLEVLHFFSVVGDRMLFRAAWKDTFDLRKNYFLCVFSHLCELWVVVLLL